MRCLSDGLGTCRMAFSVHMDVNLGFKSKSRTCGEIEQTYWKAGAKNHKKVSFFCAVNGLSLYLLFFFLSPFTLCFEKRLEF